MGGRVRRHRQGKGAIMSICTCDNCGTFIDSDFDPDCFVEDNLVLCEEHRQDLPEDHPYWGEVA